MHAVLGVELMHKCHWQIPLEELTNGDRIVVRTGMHVYHGHFTGYFPLLGVWWFSFTTDEGIGMELETFLLRRVELEQVTA